MPVKVGQAQGDEEEEAEKYRLLKEGENIDV
jgi:hypothetical protein